jgi:hypothetical protein
VTAALNILVLHRLGDPLYWRTAVRDLEFLLPDHAGQHHYLVHAADQPLPAFIKDLRFDAIVLGPTFLCARYAPHVFAAVMDEYDFVRTSDAFKIAMPQDDYDCHLILDRWMSDWQVDLVYAACSEHWDILYPGFAPTGRIRQGYTGYIANSWLEAFSNPKPFAERAIDVSYRARKLPPNYGRIGFIKGVIGERFAAQPATAALKLDLSTAEDDLIAGDKWHAFLNDSRFCLATNTGSSLLDPEGGIRRCVEHHLMRKPLASFEEVEAHCFPGEDGRYSFTAISPRNIEAALAGTVQIATPGPYGGLLRANEHYLPIEPDCSNAADVVAQMRDHDRVERIRRHAREAVLSVPELRSANHAATLVEQISEGSAAKGVQPTPAAAMKEAIDRYRRTVTDQADRFWAKRRRRQKLHDLAVSLGARKLKRWLVNPR